MHAKQETRLFVDRVFVVGETRAIGGADLAEDCAALFHDLGDSKAVPDFDEFAARDNDFAAASKSRESDQDGGGAIVDDDRGFRAREALEQLGSVNVALAARAGFEIVFQIAVLRGRAAKFLRPIREAARAPDSCAESP